MIKNFVFGGNDFAWEEIVLYINHSGKNIEIYFNMKIKVSLAPGIGSRMLQENGNYFAQEEIVLYINHSGKYIEINFNMKIPFSPAMGISRLYGNISLKWS